jgi:hypothetical protein
MSQRVPDRLTTALRDLDPAGRSVALSEEERARADATFSRIVSESVQHRLPAQPGRPRRVRLLRRVVVAAGLVGAAGVATATLLVGGTAFGSWTPTPVTLVGDAATTAAASCRVALDVPDRGERVILAERRGDWTYVLLAASHTEAACLLPNDVVGGQDHSDYEGKIFGNYDPDEPPAPRVARDRIRETMSMSGRTDEGMFNWSEGYVGRDVVGVTLHTPSGLKVQASVKRGRFAAWWPAGDVRGDNPETTDAPTFFVTLADGSTRRESSR